MRHVQGIATLLVLGLMGAVPALADEEQNWGLSPYLGIYRPSLGKLNNGLFKSPYTGTADLVDALGNTEEYNFTFNVPLPSLNPSPLEGLEFQYRLNDRNWLLMGGGTWQAGSNTTTLDSFPIEGQVNSVQAQRSASLSFSEFYFGWRHDLFVKPKKYRFYVSLSAHEAFDVEYRENFTMLFLNGPPATFGKSAIMTANATGLLLLEGMAGGEWFLTHWFSVGAEGGYVQGLQRLQLTNGDLTVDFLATDDVNLQLPAIPGNNQRLEYKSEPSGAYQSLRLDFNGWKALIKATIYF